MNAVDVKDFLKKLLVKTKTESEFRCRSLEPMT